MSSPHKTIDRDKAHPSVYLLADNLDALLAAGEDIVRLAPDAAAPAGTDALTEVTRLRGLTEQARALELTIVARALQARLRCTELRGVDTRFKPMIDLFVGGTAAFVDAVAECGDATLADFQTGDCLVAYLTQRGALGDRTQGSGPASGLRIGPGFRIVGRIELGPMMDMCAAFLDLLETHYALYDEPDATPEAGSVPAAA